MTLLSDVAEGGKARPNGRIEDSLGHSINRGSLLAPNKPSPANNSISEGCSLNAASKNTSWGARYTRAHGKI